jgi:hypothetical protein
MELAPSEIADIVTVVCPTEKPILLVKVVPLLVDADAVMFAAPAELRPAGAIWIVATPEALVSAVAAVGVGVTRSLTLNVKETTELATGFLSPSMTVAVTSAGLPVDIVVTAAPVATSVKDKVSVPVEEVLPEEPLDEDDPEPEPPAPPPPQPATSMASAIISPATAVRIDPFVIMALVPISCVIWPPPAAGLRPPAA